MISKIMELCCMLSGTCYGSIDQWILYDDNEGYIHIDGINHSHTLLFKVRFKKSDFGLSFKYPCMYNTMDALNNKWRLRRMDITHIYDKSHFYLIRFDDVFDISYDTIKYAELERFFHEGDCKTLQIRNGKFNAVYNIELLQDAVLPDIDKVNMKLIGFDMPLRLNYKHDLFEVYCLIAPRVMTDTHYWLRVGKTLEPKEDC